MALGRFYLAIDSLGLPNPVSQTEEPGLLEEVNVSEAGTDLVTVIRTEKPVFTWVWNVESKLHDTLREIGHQNQVTLNYRGRDYVGRFRVESDKLVERSYLTDGTDGLYEMTCTFTTK
jgi:hypothetical protein